MFCAAICFFTPTARGRPTDLTERMVGLRAGTAPYTSRRPMFAPASGRLGG